MLLDPILSTSASNADASHSSWLRTVRPFGAYSLYGLVSWEGSLVTIDSLQGYLLQVDPATDSTTVLNPQHTTALTDAAGVAIAQDILWFTKDNVVYQGKGLSSGEAFQALTPMLTLDYPANGIAVWDSTLYVASQRLGYIGVFDAKTGRQITRFHAPGIGVENLTVQGEDLWVCDTDEQTVYCMDRATGAIRFSLLTPFERPTGLAFHADPQTGKPTLYVAYASEEAYIRDNPNATPSHELAVRDRTFIHPLYFHYYEQERYTLSNGYLIELSYVEELAPLEDVHLNQLEWRIALPSETHRQKLRHVEPIGRPFVEEVQDGQRVALFKFDRLEAGERHIFGWRAILEVWGIKYQLKPRELETLPPLPPEYQERYMQDDDELAMETEVIQQAARVAIGTETNLLRKILKIRNYVYDRLAYGIKPHIDPPDVALERGVGSCGEYLGVLLALSRLNGIACRTVGRYKCPPQADRPYVPLYPDFNHVWMEFYVPGFGWLPMESNPDDIYEGGPYPTRFFMGLAWYHTELGKGISFEKIKTADESLDVSIGDLSLNHIRYKILTELQPEAPQA